MITDITIREYLSSEKETYGELTASHRGVQLKVYKPLSLAEWETVMEKIKDIDIRYELAEEAANRVNGNNN